LSQQLNIKGQDLKESPEYLRMSLSSAMALGLRKGRFYRNAKSPCVNLPLDDSLLGRHNFVHTPHIAGRTMDANQERARILADQFLPLGKLSKLI